MLQHLAEKLAEHWIFGTLFLWAVGGTSPLAALVWPVLIGARAVKWYADIKNAVSLGRAELAKLQGK